MELFIRELHGDGDDGNAACYVHFSSCEHTYQNGCVHDLMLYAAKKVEYHFTKRLPETATAKQKSELILECSLSEDKPSVVWRNNGVVIEVRTQYCSFFSAFSL